jgi:hypothetical protein
MAALSASLGIKKLVSKVDIHYTLGFTSASLMHAAPYMHYPLMHAPYMHYSLMHAQDQNPNV